RALRLACTDRAGARDPETAPMSRFAVQSRRAPRLPLRAPASARTQRTQSCRVSCIFEGETTARGTRRESGRAGLPGSSRSQDSDKEQAGVQMKTSGLFYRALALCLDRHAGARSKL